MTHISQPIPLGVDDARLLERFIATHDEAAFTALVARHGPMVLGICRRILRSHSDADDAFQTSFLLLALKAKHIKQPELLGNWLFGVAARTSVGIRRAADRRVVQEKRLMRILKTAQPDHTNDADFRMMLDEQISRLPEKLRRVLVCCHLEGLTKREAAERLKIPDSTIMLRLTQARDLLRRRLGGNGANLSDASLGAILVAAAVPVALSIGTVKAATLAASGKVAAAGIASGKGAGISKSVSNALLAAKIKLAASVVVASALAVSGGAMVVQQAAPAPTSAPATQPAAAVQLVEPVHGGKFASHMRDVISKLQMYASTHHNELPPDLKTAGIEDKRINYLGRAGVRTGGIPTAYKIAIIAEVPAPEYTGPIYVGFVDGHVQQFPQAVAQKSIDESLKVIAYQASGKQRAATQPAEVAKIEVPPIVADPGFRLQPIGASAGVLAHVESVEPGPASVISWRWTAAGGAVVVALVITLFAVRRYQRVADIIVARKSR